MELYFRALYSFQGDPLEEELSFAAGTVIVVVLPEDSDDPDNGGWTYGHFAGRKSLSGWFPSNYVRQIGKGSARMDARRRRWRSGATPSAKLRWKLPPVPEGREGWLQQLPVETDERTDGYNSSPN